MTIPPFAPSFLNVSLSTMNAGYGWDIECPQDMGSYAGHVKKGLFSSIASSIENLFQKFPKGCAYFTNATTHHVCAHHISGSEHNETISLTCIRKDAPISQVLNWDEPDGMASTVRLDMNLLQRTHGSPPPTEGVVAERACDGYVERRISDWAVDTATDPGHWIVSPWTLGRTPS